MNVSPGVNPRPSLNDASHFSSVQRGNPVSPGVNPRPSLNGFAGNRDRAAGVQVSPGVNPRPSLNVLVHGLVDVEPAAGVAGGEPPALIERRHGCRTWVAPVECRRG